jgi:dTDP-4-amino-4,6-dideoxygalactose transaminase
MMRIPLFEIRDNPTRKNAENAALSVLRSGQYLMGPALKSFEDALAGYQDAAHAYGVANGTDALVIAMLALGIRKGDHIATVPNAGGYSSFAALMAGAVPVMVDIDPDTHQMDIASLTAVLAKTDIKAIVATHLYGMMAPIADIMAVAGNHRIPVIEDNAQAMGAAVGPKKSGSSAAISAFSYYPTKNLGACGDAGAITTSDAQLAERVRMLRQYGWGEKYRADIPYGRNSRMDDIQAAILHAKMLELDADNTTRRKIWARYRDSAKGLKFIGRDDPSFIAHLCVAQADDAPAWQAYLQRNGVATAVHYPVADFDQPALKGVVETPVPLSNAQNVKGRIFTLPCFPEMTDAEVTYVCDLLKTGPQ